MLVFENHGTYDFVHENNICDTCPIKKPHPQLHGSYRCYGECNKNVDKKQTKD